VNSTDGEIEVCLYGRDMWKYWSRGSRRWTR